MKRNGFYSAVLAAVMAGVMIAGCSSGTGKDKIIDDDTLARLLSFNNVIVTSHQAFFTKEAMTNIAHTTLQNVKDFVEGRPLVNEVAVGRV